MNGIVGMPRATGSLLIRLGKTSAKTHKAYHHVPIISIIKTTQDNGPTHRVAFSDSFQMCISTMDVTDYGKYALSVLS